MGMTIRTSMHDPILTLAQWLSPGFPVGAFAYSQGLETAMASGQVSSAATLTDWLQDICLHGAGQSDLVLLAAAWAGETPLGEVDTIARAFAPSAERLQEADLQGAAFVETVNAVWNADLPRLTYPVAVGAAAKHCHIPLPPTARLYLQAMLANLVSAAVRFLPLGQTEGQAVLHTLHPLVLRTADAAIETPLENLSAAGFAADIAAMRHETLQPRIFRT